MFTNWQKHYTMHHRYNFHDKDDDIEPQGEVAMSAFGRRSGSSRQPSQELALLLIIMMIMTKNQNCVYFLTGLLQMAILTFLGWILWTS